MEGDEIYNDSYSFTPKHIPEELNRCPLSEVLIDTEISKYLRLHQDMKAYSVLPEPGGLFQQSDKIMTYVRVIDSEANRIRSQEMKETREG